MDFNPLSLDYGLIQVIVKWLMHVLKSLGLIL